MSISFPELQKELILDGAKAWLDPDYQEVIEENLRQCSDCGGRQTLKGFKKPVGYRAFVYCPSCGKYDEI